MSDLKELYLRKKKTDGLTFESLETFLQLALNQIGELEAEIARQDAVIDKEKLKYYRIMDMLSRLKKYKNRHGKCEPREDRACTYCNARDDLDKLVADYKGPPIVLRGGTG